MKHFEADMCLTPECLDVILKFSQLEKQHQEALESLFQAWTLVGLSGGFEGCFHHVFAISVNEIEALVAIDLGSANPVNAFQTLERCINTLFENWGIEIKTMLLSSTGRDDDSE